MPEDSNTSTSRSSSSQDSDIILVRDKSGKLKYLKDGRLYSKEELEQAKEEKQQAKEMRKEKEHIEEQKYKKMEEENKTAFMEFVAEKVIQKLKISFSRANLRKNFVRTVFEKIKGVRSDK